jgi:uncharacterized protein (TIGR03503 family)
MNCRCNHLKRHNRYKRAVFCLQLWVCVFSLGAGASAADRDSPAERATIDVVLLFDASGSMLKTDPQKLRYEGAKLLLSFLGESDRLGIVQFAATAKVVQEMAPFSPSRIGETTQKIKDIVAEGAFTDIAEGIKLSKTLLEQAPRPEATRVIVLLSDGKVEPDPKVAPAFARTLELVHDVLPDLKAKETKVFTLALSEQADRAFLGEIAAATDGLTWYTQSAEDIHKSFAELFLAMKRPQVVAQTGRGFTIDQDVEEATFYINHLPEETLGLVSPKGQEFSAEKRPEYVTWFTGRNFDVVTITEPEAGNWQVVGTQAQDGFATVLTDLKLLTDWPLVVRAGDTPLVQARLYEENKPVSLPEMSEVLKVGFQIVPTDQVSKPIVQEPLNDEGQQGDTIARDGIFSSITGPMRVGSYKLVVAAKGPTFQRSQQIPFTVRPRLITLEIKRDNVVFDEERGELGTTSNTSSADVSHVEGADPLAGAPGAVFSGDETTELVVAVSKEAAGFRNYEIQLSALSAERERTDVVMKKSPSNPRYFSVSASVLPKDGVFKLKAVLKGEVKKGEEVYAESAPISFQFKSRVARPVVKESESHHTEKHEAAPVKQNGMRLPLLPIAITTVLNGVVLAGLLSMLRGKQKQSRPTEQKYLPHKQLLDAIANLEEKVSASSIELDDPIFATLSQAALDEEREGTGRV